MGLSCRKGFCIVEICGPVMGIGDCVICLKNVALN